MNHYNVKDFDRALDDCLDRVRRGEGIEQCLAHYPQHASRLEPLLRTAQQTHTAYVYEPSPSVTQAARAKLNAARAERAAAAQSRPRPRVFGGLSWLRPLPVAAIASIAVIALTVLLLVRPTLTPPPVVEQPGEDVPVPVTPDNFEPVFVMPSAHPDGDFVFYLSDEPNAINDFESLVVTISSIILKPLGEEPWVRLLPTQEQADLVQLQGNRSLELWRGDVPEGTYTMVFLLIEHVEGILVATGESINLKLPSERLHLNLEFELQPGEFTEFVFDITVRRIGPPDSPVTYLLLPQASESGIGRSIERVDLHGRPDEPGAQRPGDTDSKRTPGRSDSEPTPGQPDVPVIPKTGPAESGPHWTQTPDQYWYQAGSAWFPSEYKAIMCRNAIHT